MSDSHPSRRGPLFHGYEDPDPQRPAHDKLAVTIWGYVSKFGRAPTQCITSAEDAAALRARPVSWLVQITPRDYCSRGKFYVGEPAL